MKKFIFLFLFVIGFLCTTMAQCSRVASGFGNNIGTPSYNITGGVEVVLNSNNTLTLNLANDFMTASGPDVKAYLMNPETRTLDMLKALNLTTFPNVPKILFGVVAANAATPPVNPNGIKTFTVDVPKGVNIADYTKIFFYCQKFNTFWDLGTIANFAPNNCSILSLQDFQESTFKIYPNPVTENLSLDLDIFTNDLSANIYNMLGSLVYTKKNITVNDNKINLSQLTKGVYLIELKEGENKKFIKRFVKAN